MGGLADFLGLNSSVNVNSGNAYEAIQPWQQNANSLQEFLRAQVNGTGINPAQLQYNANAARIASEQAGTYAQNRALNPGLAARLAGNTGANIQLQAANQAQVQQQQQQLGAEQLSIQNNASQQQALNQASGINAGVAAGNQQASSNLIGGILGGAGAIGAAAMLNHGGSVHNYADGSPDAVSADNLSMPAFGSSTQQSPQPYSLGAETKLPDADPTVMNPKAKSGAIGAAAQAGSAIQGALTNNSIDNAFNRFSRYMAGGGQVMPPHLAMVSQIYHPMAEGGVVPAMVSPGERYLDPNQAKTVAEGKKSPLKAGEKIHGKAKVKGDSEKNDTVPKNLEEGGVVIPRSVLNSDDPEKAAQKFVAKALRDHKKSPEGEFHEALKRSIAGRKSK